jgi:hypothetical protein
MLCEPIETRYRKENRMFHSSAFAIAAGVVGVAGAATSAGMGMAAADKAAKGQAAAGRKLEKRTQRATQSYQERMDVATQEFVRNQNELREQVAKVNPNINMPQYNLQDATLEGIEAANRVTANTIQQVQNVSGRDPRQLFNMLAGWENRLGDQYVQVQQGMPLIDQQQAVVSGMIRGELPEVTQQQISRALAERGGAGFSMQAAGRTPFIQRPQAMLAENIRQSSEERMRAGLALAPGVIEQRRGVAGTAIGLSEASRGIFGSWMDAAQSFIQPVSQMMALGAQGRAQDIGIQESNIRNTMAQLGMLGDIGTGIFGAQRGYAQDIYGAQTGQAQQGYDIQQANLQAGLARDQATAQGVQGISSAAAGALGGIGSAYGQLATAQGGSTKPLSSGFYAGELGAARAYNVAPSQLSFQKGGGYYYTPSGVYGR